jgi:hypothetical protein
VKEWVMMCFTIVSIVNILGIKKSFPSNVQRMTLAVCLAGFCHETEK